ncbi:MAG: hypothetical protein ACI9VR_000617 [Cognaticolwellia sp.]|jgi:hypothetical protein
MTFLLWLSTASATDWVGCEPPEEPVTTFETQAKWVSGFKVSVELLATDSLEGLEPALKRLEESGVSATIVVPSSLLKGNEELLFGAQARGHALAMRAPASEILSTPPPPIPAPYLGAIKAQQKTFKKSLGDRPVIWSTDGLLTLAGELGVEQSRLTHVIVDSQDGVAHRVPRPDGTRGVALVLPASPIGCKGIVEPDYWHLDHATRVLMQASELRLPALRIRLNLVELDAQELEVLGTWIDQVMLPADVAFVTVNKITPEIPQSQAPSGPPPGRAITQEQLQSAAAALAGQPSPLPRSVGGYSLTELFLAFCHHASALYTEVEELPEIFVGPLKAPQESTRSSRKTPVTAAQVLAAGHDLSPKLRGYIPSFADVGDQLLTARELLWSLAWVIHTQPSGAEEVPFPEKIKDPDPSAVGLGWGTSTGREN